MHSLPDPSPSNHSSRAPCMPSPCQAECPCSEIATLKLPSAAWCKSKPLRLFGDERGHCEGKRHGKTDIAEIQKGRVKRHRPPLQQGAQPISVSNVNDAATSHRKHLKRAGNKGDHAHEESESGHHDRDHNRHHLAEFSAVRINHNGGVCC